MTGGGIPSAEAWGTPVLVQLDPARPVASTSLELRTGYGVASRADPVSSALAVQIIGTLLAAFEVGYKVGALFGSEEAWGLGLIMAVTVAREIQKFGR